MFPGPLGESLSGKALRTGIWSLATTNIRDFGIGKHRSVDDTPAGGGAGMIMRADVVGTAIEHVMMHKNTRLPLIYLSPRGKPFNQRRARELAASEGVILLCGRFEGIDERLIEVYEMEEISVGDYVLSGGEIAAMILLDAVVRLLPGVTGSEASIREDSFENGLLEYPQYTRPRQWQGHTIPEILLSGNHAQIQNWRRQKSRQITRSRRPDLLWD
jgi:tRNA (guanine37-N1)-methyltransferase